MHKFELENVLNYRVHIEETKKTEFNEIKKTIEIENKRFQENIEKHQRLEKDIEEKMQNGILIKECSIYFSCIDHMHQTLIDKKKLIDGLKDKLSKKRNELIQAVQDRKIIEKLKEYRIRDTICHENKKEIDILDEFSSQQKWHRHYERE